ncbi:MAG: aminotransferase class IV [Oligoflexia bacterium]|nr:aminotransferase class IV [Oligoflexia bacterium]
MYVTQPIVNINGTIHTSSSEAKISVFDRGLLFGDSAYEVTLAYDGVVLLLEQHLDRLWRSLAGLYIEPSFSKQLLADEIIRSVHLKSSAQSYVRIMVTRGEANKMGLDPDFSGPTNFIIIVLEHHPHPQEWYDDGVKLAFAKGVIRNDQRALDPKIKTGNYLNNFMAYMSGKAQKAYETILLNSEGVVSECSTSNIWMVRTKNSDPQQVVVQTPPVSAGILEGITRDCVLQVAQQANIEVVQEIFYPVDLLNAQECFITSATRMIIPVSSIGDHPIGSGRPGVVTLKLLALYKNFVENYIKVNQ